MAHGATSPLVALATLCPAMPGHLHRLLNKSQKGRLETACTGFLRDIARSTKKVNVLTITNLRRKDQAADLLAEADPGRRGKAVVKERKVKKEEPVERGLHLEGLIEATGQVRL